MAPRPGTRSATPPNKVIVVDKTRSPAGEAVCDCCDLRFAAERAHAWTERKLSKRLRALDPEDRPDTADEWVSGPYRYYYVDHRHRVCPECHAHLLAGGRFRGLTRNRGKLAFLALMGVVALLLALMPVLLPRLISALWLTTGGR